MKYKEQLKAIDLRKQGKSIASISKTLSVHKDTVSDWVKDIKLSDEQIKELSKVYKSKEFNDNKKNKCLNDRLTYQAEGKEKAKENNLLHAMGTMLFWAEGNKDKNTLTMSNSDPFMMKLFVKFLKEQLNVQNNEIKFSVNCFLHNENDINQVHDWWIHQLDIEGCKVNKPTVKITTEEIDNYGICRIVIGSTKLVQQLYGAIQQYANFDNGFMLENKRSRKLNNKDRAIS